VREAAMQNHRRMVTAGVIAATICVWWTSAVAQWLNNPTPESRARLMESRT
jgi:hypothetical protein